MKVIFIAKINDVNNENAWLFELENPPKGDWLWFILYDTVTKKAMINVSQYGEINKEIKKLVISKFNNYYKRSNIVLNNNTPFIYVGEYDKDGDKNDAEFDERLKLKAKEFEQKNKENKMKKDFE